MGSAELPPYDAATCVNPPLANEKAMGAPLPSSATGNEPAPAAIDMPGSGASVQQYLPTGPPTAHAVNDARSLDEEDHLHKRNPNLGTCGKIMATLCIPISAICCLAC